MDNDPITTWNHIDFPKWLHTPTEDDVFICWQVDDRVFMVDAVLVPEIISAVMLLLGSIKNGIVQDEEVKVDLERLLQEAHLQYTQYTGKENKADGVERDEI